MKFYMCLYKCVCEHSQTYTEHKQTHTHMHDERRIALKRYHFQNFLGTQMIFGVREKRERVRERERERHERPVHSREHLDFTRK